MRDATVDSHRWSRAEYDRAAEAGVFSADVRLELIDGEILDMTPQGSRHATAFSLVADAVQRAFGPGYYVRLQLPLALADDSEPEPDIAVVEGDVRDYRDEHPRTALLNRGSVGRLAPPRSDREAAPLRAVPGAGLLDSLARRRAPRDLPRPG